MPRYPENRNFSLYVTGFSDTTRPMLLTKLFERHGPVADDWHTHQPRGFAYVVFENDEDAKSAVESTESFVLDGRVLNVQFAKSPKKSPQTRNRGQDNPQQPTSDQLPERRPENAPVANLRKHSRDDSRSPVRRTRHATLLPCRRHDRHCCLHKRESTPSLSSSSCSCSRSSSPVRKAHPVPETHHRVPEAHRVYTNEAHGSRHHRRRHWYREEASVSPEPEATMPRRSGSVRNGSVHKEEISLSVDDQDW
ncbi:Arginine/serine-rich splicing factor scl25a transcript I [Podila verticillata]|nr:Arginine/serine-rich splicing factor scl25a transcript I [Podila verticillata]